jgi:hypothetical protein
VTLIRGKPRPGVPAPRGADHQPSPGSWLFVLPEVVWQVKVPQLSEVELQAAPGAEAENGTFFCPFT